MSRWVRNPLTDGLPTGRLDTVPTAGLRQVQSKTQRLKAMLAAGIATDGNKTELLALHLAEVLRARPEIHERDLTQSGLSKKDGERLYEAAIARVYATDAPLFTARSLQGAAA